MTLIQNCSWRPPAGGICQGEQINLMRLVNVSFCSSAVPGGTAPSYLLKLGVICLSLLGVPRSNGGTDSLRIATPAARAAAIETETPIKEQHWSLKPVVRPTFPNQAGHKARDGNPIDRFILAKLA